MFQGFCRRFLSNMSLYPHRAMAGLYINTEGFAIGMFSLAFRVKHSQLSWHPVNVTVAKCEWCKQKYLSLMVQNLTQHQSSCACEHLYFPISVCGRTHTWPSYSVPCRRTIMTWSPLACTHIAPAATRLEHDYLWYIHHHFAASVMVTWLYWLFCGLICVVLVIDTLSYSWISWLWKVWVYIYPCLRSCMSNCTVLKHTSSNCAR